MWILDANVCGDQGLDGLMNEQYVYLYYMTAFTEHLDFCTWLLFALVLDLL